MGETATRYLAAILAADVVGYSRLMGADEDGTLARVQALFAEVAGPAVAARQGRIFKTMGDAFLAEFPSAVGAVLCAAEVQQALATREAGRPEAARLRLRVGVHLGDVVPQGTDLFGDGVNIAARLEGVAEPGGVAMSATVAEAVRGKLPFGLEDLGEKALKNIERPVRVFRLVVAGAAVPKPARRRLGALAAGLVVVALALGGVWWAWRPVGEPVADAVPLAGPAPAATALAQPAVQQAPLSIVVLPFANLSGDPAQDYFAEGITEEITTDLSRIAGSLVINRSTAFALKNRTVELRDLGRELGVRYVLRGSVLRLGEQVRINAELSETEAGTQLWAERFTGYRHDLVALQDEVLGRIALALNYRLVNDAGRRAGRGFDIHASDLVMRAMAAINGTFSRDSMLEAQRLFGEAAARDAGNADALAGLAYTYSAMATAGLGGNREDNVEHANRFADQALALNSRHVLARTVKGIVSLTLKQPEAALAQFDQALAANSNFALALYWSARASNAAWRPNDGLRAIDRAMRLSPLDPFFGQWSFAKAEALLEREDWLSAITYLERAGAVQSGPTNRIWMLAASYALVGRPEEAQASMAEYRRRRPAATVQTLRAEGYSNHPNYLALRERLLMVVRDLGLPEQ